MSCFWNTGTFGRQRKTQAAGSDDPLRPKFPHLDTEKVFSIKVTQLSRNNSSMKAAKYSVSKQRKADGVVGGGGRRGCVWSLRVMGPFQTCFFCSTMAVSNLDRLSPCLLDRDRELDLELDRLRELERLCLRFLSDPDPRRLLDDLLTWQPSWAGSPMLIDTKAQWLRLQWWGYSGITKGPPSKSRHKC